MDDVKIDKDIESEVEAIFLLGKQLEDFIRKYPGAWPVIKRQFGFVDFLREKAPTRRIETFKLDLYVEILKVKEWETQQKEDDLSKRLKKTTI